MKAGSSRQLTFVFLAVLVPAAATLVWLGLRLLEQDRILWAQRAVERQEAAADTLVRALSQVVADAERRLSDGAPFDGAVRMRRTPAGLTVSPQSMFAWVPGPPRLPEAAPGLFEAAERLEFLTPKLADALRAYRRLAVSDDAAIRAGALLRSARVHRNAGRLGEALRDYRALSRLDAVAVAGLPADLIARRALCDLLQATGPAEAFRREVAALEEDFGKNRWALERDAWDLVTSELHGWSNRPVLALDSRIALSRAADWFHGGATASAGRHIVDAGTSPVTVVWRELGTEVRGLAIPSATLGAWLAAVRPQPATAMKVTLLGPGGEALAGEQVSPASRTFRRSAADTGLPWTIVLGEGKEGSSSGELSSRRRLLAGGLAALGILLAGGAYLLWRVVQRELAVARLQAEFVSAVSHEFRTPVTSLRHTIELLQEDDELTRERRSSFYDVLSRSTERLHRLVESLLDFGRMEEGRKPYDLQAVDPGAFVAGIAREFACDPAARGYAIDVTLEPGTPREVRADAAALGHALWNLLDNAVKYSPGSTRVTLSVSPHPGGAAIAVCDRGFGIPRSERTEIFLRFVRGEKAHRLGIKGTGVGLAIVSHIMRAHGGSVEVESEEGKGSTFRLVLPVAP